MSLSSLTLEFESLVTAAGKLAISTRDTMTSELKPDGSIVTNADRLVEEFLRKELVKIVPGATFWGEEYGFEEPSEAGFWLIDPIDGTSNYRYGLPLWGVTVGFMKGGVLEMGCIELPDAGWTLTAERNQGAYLNRVPMSPIPPGDIRSEELMGRGESTHMQKTWPGKMRHLGSFVGEAALVAKQSMRAMVSSRAKLYDAAGGAIICRELGADLRELDGRPWNEAEWQKVERMRPFYIGPKDSNFPFES